MHRSTEEITEIERHKYFLSEKRGQDVGWEFAEQDWERHYGEQWRRQHGGSGSAQCEGERRGGATACCQQEKPLAVEDYNSAAEPEVHEATLRKDPGGRPAERGALRWLLARLFSQQTP